MAERILVTVVYSPAPREVQEWPLVLDAGATVLDALRQSGLTARLDLAALAVTVWGRKARPAQALRARDRVEVLRPLKVDPKVARRERFQKQGARSAGLFAKRRAGAKAGY